MDNTWTIFLAMFLGAFGGTFIANMLFEAFAARRWARAMTPEEEYKTNVVPFLPDDGSPKHTAS